MNICNILMAVSLVLSILISLVIVRGGKTTGPLHEPGGGHKYYPRIKKA
jgi:hypothetical protein